MVLEDGGDTERAGEWLNTIGDKDPERDTILDPKRQRGFVPFIGLSAKSSLQ